MSESGTHAAGTGATERQSQSIALVLLFLSAYSVYAQIVCARLAFSKGPQIGIVCAAHVTCSGI